MSLMPGTRLGPYEIVASLGAGGMGEVYRAKDTHLDRDVAIKVVPASFALDADRVARFTREAKTLAALNHPNIAQIYGLEKTAEVTALVMELVEGEDVSAHIARGAMPLADALPIARQVAEALAAAHEKGIVHRDLKPANIMLTADGHVKVLDFGLAKALAPEGSSTDVETSPTMTARATELGIILGTAAYMSPEQAKGRAVDRRADVWAFGVVLYEMLTGRRAFAGDDVTEVLAAVIRDTPEWTLLPAGTPVVIRRLLRRCLERNRAKRLDSMRAVQLEIDDALGGSTDETSARVSPTVRGLRPWVSAILVVGAAMAGAVAGAALWPRSPEKPAVTRFEISLPAGVTLGGLSLTADGRSLVYSTTSGSPGGARLYRRDLDRLDSQPIPGSDGAEGPAISPDGAWVAFFLTGKTIAKLPLSGGPVVRVAEAPYLVHGLAWDPPGHLLVGQHEGGMKRVATAAGSALEALTDTGGKTPHRYPRVLPGGRGVLFMTYGSKAGDEVAVLPAGSTEWRVLASGSFPEYLPTGDLLFWRDDNLWAAPFDLQRLTLGAEPVPVIAGVLGNDRRAVFECSNDGTLFYGVETSRPTQRLVWVTRDKKEIPIDIPAAKFDALWLSPNGQRLLARQDGKLWVYDLQRGGPGEALTTGKFDEWAGLWSPDGRNVVFTSRQEGPFKVYRISLSGTRSIEPLDIPPGSQPVGWTPDSKDLLYQLRGELRAWRFQEKKSDVLVSEPGNARDTAVVSPDGRFVAFALTTAIAVRPFPDLNANRWSIPVAELRTAPRWSPSSREVLYRAGSAVMSVPVAIAGDDRVGAARKLFEGDYGPAWDVAPDGRFLMVKGTSPVGAGDRIVVVRNWFTELKQKVPAR
jgi:hypothetical protein